MTIGCGARRANRRSRSHVRKSGHSRSASGNHHLQGRARARCVAACCNVLRRVAVCCPCNVQKRQSCHSRIASGNHHVQGHARVAACCSVLQRVAACCSVLQSVALTVSTYENVVDFLFLLCKCPNERIVSRAERWGAGVEYHFQEI